MRSRQSPRRKAPVRIYRMTKKTSDPSPGIGKLIAEGIRKALADALMVAIILIMKELKAAADEDCEKDYGSMSGKITDDDAKKAFAEAGIPPDFAPTVMACLLKKITKAELEDLFKGIISDEVRAAIKLCALEQEGMQDYLPAIPDAFEALK